MFSQIKIKGYRGLQEFELSPLGRVNLLVGANNCGKSSILEAIQILASAGEPASLLKSASRRGEWVHESARGRAGFPAQHDLSHLFHGHAPEPPQAIEIASSGVPALELVTIQVGEQSAEARGTQQEVFADEDGTGSSDFWSLLIDWTNHSSNPIALPISDKGVVSFDSMRRYSRSQAEDAVPVEYVSTAGLSVGEVVRMFESVVLNPQEELVLNALRIIEPDIDRLATVGSDSRRTHSGDRGGIVVKSRSTGQRVPIGSLGDGMWRMLGLALALASTEGGILLIDEIDTGLHYSVLDGMWKMLAEAAERLSTQVFATTHSRDCYEALASIAHEGVSSESNVTIQRIEPNRKRSVVFTEQEIVAAADRGMEVR